MDKNSIALALIALLAVLAATFRPVTAQEAFSGAVVCAPCAGEPFGLSGTGMVWMSAGGLYFYPLDRSQAVTYRPPQFGAVSRLQTAPILIGRMSGIGEPLVWANK